MIHQQAFSRRKILQLLSLTALGSFSIQGHAHAESGFKDSFDEQIDPIHLKKGEGMKASFGGVDMLMKFSKHQTNGNLGCNESTLKPGFLGAPPHLHKLFDEICFVLEGTVSILVEDKVVEVNAGDWHFRPRNKMHTFWNGSSTPARYIDIYTPGGHEEYLTDLAKLFEKNSRPRKEDMNMLEKKHDIVYMWDKLPGIMEKYKVHL